MRGISIESGIRFNTKTPESKLRKLKPVLKNWVKIVQEYSKVFKNSDACWWYTERANVGILAAAAWRVKGWIALEEFSTLKRGVETVSKNGRCDLYVAKKDHDNSFAFEAKPAWQTMRSDGISKITAQLEEAWKDAGKLKKIEGKTRVAACFAIPNVPSRLTGNNFDSQILEWLTDALNTVKWDAVAWVFPKESRQLKSEAGTRIFPGVLLVLQERHRSNRISKKVVHRSRTNLANR